MTNQQRRKVQALIREHVNAQIELSWSGSAEPSDRVAIAAHADDSKRKLYSYLSLLVER